MASIFTDVILSTNLPKRTFLVFFLLCFNGRYPAKYEYSPSRVEVSAIIIDIVKDIVSFVRRRLEFSLESKVLSPHLLMIRDLGVVLGWRREAWR
jgi:hypothetical protein